MNSKMNILVFVLTPILFSTGSYAGDVLTKQSVLVLAQRMESAAVRRDVNGVLKHLSPELRVVTKIQTPSGDQTVPMDYEAYKTSLAHIWKAASEYSYRQGSLDISLSPNKQQATITAVIRETYVLDGSRISTLTREISTVKLVGRRPMVVKIYAEQLE